MGSANGNWRQVGCAVLLTAAVAFPAGLWLASSRGVAPPLPTPLQTPRAKSPAASELRNPYSATIRTDAYVLGRQRALVEAMESDCRHNGSGCSEARAARNYLGRMEAPD